MNAKEIERKIFKEIGLNAARLERGLPRKIGTMERLYPGAYKACEDMCSEIVQVIPFIANSESAAKNLSAMLHSDDESLSSINSYLKTIQIDALMLAALVRLEREKEPSRFEKIARSEIGKKGAEARHAKSIKQKPKKFIKECWAEWQENPTKYKKQSDFVKDVLEKIDTDDDGNPIISFDTVLKNWIPKWTKERK